jgi:hypothetical protein
MRRRLLLVAAAAAVLPCPALAQQRGRKPPPLEIPKQPAVPQPWKSGEETGSTAAPIPDRSVEGPRVVEQDRTRLNPSILNRSLPGRGQVDQGSPDILEDKLFKPGPGAKLQVPFSY